jgi:hypothetical protein
MHWILFNRTGCTISWIRYTMAAQLKAKHSSSITCRNRWNSCRCHDFIICDHADMMCLQLFVKETNLKLKTEWTGTDSKSNEESITQLAVSWRPSTVYNLKGGNNNRNTEAYVMRFISMKFKHSKILTNSQFVIHACNANYLVPYHFMCSGVPSWNAANALHYLIFCAIRGSFT